MPKFRLAPTGSRRHRARQARTSGTRARKNMVIDQRKLDRARRILGAPTETAAVDLALDLVAFRGEVLAGIDRLLAVGGLDDAFSRR